MTSERLEFTLGWANAETEEILNLPGNGRIYKGFITYLAPSSEKGCSRLRGRDRGGSARLFGNKQRETLFAPLANRPETDVVPDQISAQLITDVCATARRN